MKTAFSKVSAVFVSIIFVLAIVALFGSSSFVQQASASTSTSTTQTINITVNQVITLSLSSTTLSLGALTPGTPVTATSSATVTTNATAGWSLDVNRTSATSTIASGTITFPDATNIWNGTNNATTSVHVGSNLSFRAYSAGTSAGIYNATAWGSDDAGNALFAGFPTSTQIYASTSTYTGSAQTVVMELRADAPATQVATNYAGTITITAIALP